MANEASTSLPLTTLSAPVCVSPGESRSILVSRQHHQARKIKAVLLPPRHRAPCLARCLAHLARRGNHKIVAADWTTSETEHPGYVRCTTRPSHQTAQGDAKHKYAVAKAAANVRQQDTEPGLPLEKFPSCQTRWITTRSSRLSAVVGVTDGLQPREASTISKG